MGAVKHLSTDIPEDPKNSPSHEESNLTFTTDNAALKKKSTVTNGRNFTSGRQNKRAIQSPLSVEGKDASGWNNEAADLCTMDEAWVGYIA